MRERLAELALEIAQEAQLAAYQASDAERAGNIDGAREALGRSKGLLHASQRMSAMLKETA